jgi:hypothetical protein
MISALLDGLDRVWRVRRRDSLLLAALHHGDFISGRPQMIDAETEIRELGYGHRSRIAAVLGREILLI